MTNERASNSQIDANIAVHDRIAAVYDLRHGEIFNPVEQARLAAALSEAKAALNTGSPRPRALDFGCGSGNLTRHLFDLGFAVTAADVSPKFLQLVERRFGASAISTLRLNGKDLEGIASESFDFAATYSVLHHVPDYLGSVAELARVVKPGGIVYIDHEQPGHYWQSDGVREEFYRQGRTYDWRKWLVPSNYVHKIWRLFDPRHANEGDIHVWPDDHVEWDRVCEVLAGAGCDPVMQQDYLIFRAGYRPEVFERYRDRCSDMRVMAFRKRQTG